MPSRKAHGVLLKKGGGGAPATQKSKILCTKTSQINISFKIPVFPTTKSGSGGGGVLAGLWAEREEGGGIWDPKVCVPKLARQIFPVANFVFPHDGHFGLGGVRGGGGVLLAGEKMKHRPGC